MIALTDVGIAHLMTAARAVEPRDRRRWLQAVADQFDPHPDAASRAAGRRRWHRWAANNKAGVAVTRVRYSSVGLAKLIVAGWLTGHKEVYSDTEIGAAIADMLEHGNLPPKQTR
jgi:hypothetical protein